MHAVATTVCCWQRLHLVEKLSTYTQHIHSEPTTTDTLFHQNYSCLWLSDVWGTPEGAEPAEPHRADRGRGAGPRRRRRVEAANPRRGAPQAAERPDLILKMVLDNFHWALL
eukprot:4476407-Pyramimonas_sp.AAC.1